MQETVKYTTTNKTAPGTEKADSLEKLAFHM